MTYAEMSAELDVVYENINKNGAPGLDGYEKSVILTHAEELYVKEMLQREPDGSRFPELISIHTDINGSAGSFDPEAFNFTLPSSYLKILNEEILATDVDDVDRRFTVLPLTNEQFTTQRSSAYKYPPRRRAWRLPISETTGKVEVYLRAGLTDPTYSCRYVRKPKPIIVENLSAISSFASGIVESWAITAPGTGYVLGDTITLNGVTASPVFEVSGVTGGAVTSVVMLSNGYGMTDNTVYNTVATPSAGRSGLTITVQTVNAYTIDGYYLPMDCELNPALHRDILKLAANVAEQYYMDKYGNNNGTAGNQ